METIDIAGVSAITVICYLSSMAIKASKINNKWIPLINGVLGGILGVIGMFIMPDFPARDILTAIAVGIVSGLAATGVNQVYKQLAESEKNEYEEKINNGYDEEDGE